MEKLKYLILLCIFMTGCTTVSSLKSNPRKGYSTSSFVDLDEAGIITEKVLEENGIKIKSYEKISDNEVIIIGSNGMSLASYGELIKVYLEKERNKVLFYVESRPKMKTNYMAEDHGPKIINGINVSLQTK